MTKALLSVNQLINHQNVNTANYYSLPHVTLSSGSHWWSKQVPDQWDDCAEQSCAGLLQVRAAQCQQPTFPDHARTHHKSAQHEAS